MSYYDRKRKARTSTAVTALRFCLTAGFLCAVLWLCWLAAGQPYLRYVAPTTRTGR